MGFNGQELLGGVRFILVGSGELKSFVSITLIGVLSVIGKEFLDGKI